MIELPLAKFLQPVHWHFPFCRCRTGGAGQLEPTGTPHCCSNLHSSAFRTAICQQKDRCGIAKIRFHLGSRRLQVGNGHASILLSIWWESYATSRWNEYWSKTVVPSHSDIQPYLRHHWHIDVVFREYFALRCFPVERLCSRCSIYNHLLDVFSTCLPRSYSPTHASAWRLFPLYGWRYGNHRIC